MRFLKDKGNLRGIIGILVIVLAVAIIILWENWGRTAIMNQDVLVFVNDVGEHEVVTMEMLGIQSVNKGAVIKDAITNPNDIIGKETTTAVPAGLQLSERFFSDTNLALGEDKYIFELPRDWVYYCPQNLRRGDTLYFYPLQVEGRTVGQTNTEEPDLSQGNFTESEIAAISEGKTKPILSTIVSYAKNNSNQEVIDAEGSEERENGTSTIANISVIVTEQQYNTLKKSFEAGNRFVLLYR